MKNIYFIFDETDIGPNFQILGCIVIDDDIFFEELKNAQKIFSIKPGFGELKNKYPHYTEDSHSQRLNIVEEYRKLGYKVYINIREVVKHNGSFECLYINNLIPLIKPVILKFIKKYGKDNLRFSFIFEELSNNSIDFFTSIITESIESISKDIKIISKNGCNGATSVIDYTCGVLREFLMNKNHNQSSSFGKSIFEAIINKFGYIKFDLLGEEEFYYFNNEEQINKFIHKYHGAFTKK